MAVKDHIVPKVKLIQRKACGVTKRYPRIYHGSHVGAHLVYFVGVMLEGHGIGTYAAGALTLLTLYGMLIKGAQGME